MSIRARWQFRVDPVPEFGLFDAIVTEATAASMPVSLSIGPSSRLPGSNEILHVELLVEDPDATERAIVDGFINHGVHTIEVDRRLEPYMTAPPLLPAATYERTTGELTINVADPAFPDVHLLLTGEPERFIALVHFTDADGQRQHEAFDEIRTIRLVHRPTE